MEKTMKQKLLDAIGKVYEKSENCRLSEQFFEQMHIHLALLSEYFKVSIPQSLFISVVFAMNYQGRRVDFNDLIRYFECNPMKLLAYNEDFEALVNEGILSRERSRRRRNVMNGNEEFRVSEAITEAILKNKPMPVMADTTCNDIVDLLEHVVQLVDDREEHIISSGDLFGRVIGLLHNNSHLPLVKKLLDSPFAEPDLVLFLMVVWQTISGKKSADLGRLTEILFDVRSDRVRYMQGIMMHDNPLMEQDLLEIEDSHFLNDVDVSLSENGVAMLEAAGLKVHVAKKKNNGIILPANIPLRELIYNSGEARQLSLLKNLLAEDNFRTTMERLRQKNLPAGIVALLHGSPGTGKTETVLQLARETGREIMKVDISQSKSMWFGESEKIIKRIFSNYSGFAKDCEQMPILLFNEADALLSKRRDPGASNVAQTENAIQNILLEELENFSGIFFATTNLVGNLDPAFERRFLFKIEFHQPDIQARAGIWKLKLPALTDDQCRKLADTFRLSGGQIDNIGRKYEIHTVLHGDADVYEKAYEFCNDEELEKTAYNPVGFRK